MLNINKILKGRLSFEEALKVREEKLELEYELKAARITSWIYRETKLKKKDIEALYNEIYYELLNSDSYDEDQLGVEIAKKLGLIKRGPL
jgi:hypothetical protein